jgi:hypothetical protein
MESAEKTALVEQRVSWAKKHWLPFFSEMPLRITSLESLQQPFATIIRAAENSARFSALNESTARKMLGNKSRQKMDFTI